MAKKTFNFSNSPAAREINEQMENVQQAPAVAPTGKKSSRMSGDTWTLVQARIPSEVQRRMAVYCATHNMKKGEFIVQAVTEYLEKIGG